MKTLKKNLFFALSATLMLFVACGEDDDGVEGDLESAASIQFDGKTWTNPAGEDIILTEIGFNDESFISIGGNVVNGTDTLSLAMTLGSREVGTYTSTADTTAFVISLTTLSDEAYLTSIVGELEEGASYSLTITNSSASAVSGEFSATLVNQTGDSKTATGTFTAIDLFGSFFQ